MPSADALRILSGESMAEKKEYDYIVRQKYIVTQIGLFYAILVGLFAIPLIGTFVVVMIKGVLDFKNIILYGGLIIFIVAIILFIRFSKNLMHKVREDGLAANDEVKERLSHGEPVQIDLFDGLVSFKYGGRDRLRALPEKTTPAQEIRQIEQEPASGCLSGDLIERLERLASLKNQGIIDETEFQELKKRLIHDSEDD